MSNVGRDVPAQVLRANDVAAEYQLDTTVANITQIAVVAARTHSLGDRHPEEQVGGLLVIEIEATRQSVLPQTELNTNVEVGCGLPGDVLITYAIERGRHRCVTGLGYLVQFSVCPVGNVVVTLLADRCLQLQLVQPRLGIFHEVLLVDKPCTAYRPERTPAVVLGEARCSVATIRG